MPILAGASYSISTCGSPYDTQITGFQGNNTATAIFYNDDNGPVCGGTAASVNYISSFTDYTRINVNQYNCQSLASPPVTTTVNVRQNNNLAITSSSAPMCAGDTRTLTATPAPVASSLPNSGNNGTFSGTGVSGSTFTAPTPAGVSQTYTNTYTFGYCSSTQDITVYLQPTTSAAGADQPSVCGLSTVLQGNIPAIGTGSWTTASGPGTASSPSAPNSTVNGLVKGTPTTMQWTITNGTCTPSTDQVVLTVETDPPVPVLPSLVDVLGQCSATPPTPLANDTCSGVVAGTSDTVFPVTAEGTTVVTWTYDDGLANTATQTQNVIIDDTIAPVPDAFSLAPVTGCYSVSSSAPTATDNCSGGITGTTGVVFPITDEGTTVVTWTYDDGRGNSSTQTQNFTVNTVNVGVKKIAGTLTALALPATYQWVDCDNGNSPIAGATSRSFTPTENGNYAVEVTENACVDISACYYVEYFPWPMFMPAIEHQK